jgi:hypothetical protein
MLNEIAENALSDSDMCNWASPAVIQFICSGVYKIMKPPEKYVASLTCSASHRLNLHNLTAIRNMPIYEYVHTFETLLCKPKGRWFQSR